VRTELALPNAGTASCLRAEVFTTEAERVGDLGLVLGMDNGTLTPLLKRLETAGLVTRTRDSADERRVLIDLTKAGQALRQKACSVPEKIETACRLTHEDLVELRDTLNGLALPRSASDSDFSTD